MTRMHGIKIGIVVSALGSQACAEVYAPRPTAAVTLSGNGGAGYRVWKHGEDLGGEASVLTAVRGDPRAEAEAETAASQRTGSFVTNLAGAVAWGVGWGLLATDAGSSPNQFPSTVGDVGIGLIVGGVALYIAGGALAGASHTHMFNAVNIYNDDMVLRPEPRPVGSPSTLTPPAVYIAPGPGYAPQPVYPAPPSTPLPPSELPPLPPSPPTQ